MFKQFAICLKCFCWLFNVLSKKFYMLREKIPLACPPFQWTPVPSLHPQPGHQPHHHHDQPRHHGHHDHHLRHEICYEEDVPDEMTMRVKNLHDIYVISSGTRPTRSLYCLWCSTSSWSPSSSSWSSWSAWQSCTRPTRSLDCSWCCSLFVFLLLPGFSHHHRNKHHHHHHYHQQHSPPPPPCHLQTTVFISIRRKLYPLLLLIFRANQILSPIYSFTFSASSTFTFPASSTLPKRIQSPSGASQIVSGGCVNGILEFLEIIILKGKYIWNIVYDLMVLIALMI